MEWREVRKRHQLLFRFNPDLDLIEVMVRGRLETVRLSDYRPPQQRRALGPEGSPAGVNFDRIDGVDEDAQMC